MITLKPRDYCRMIIVTVSCWCGAKRGQGCTGTNGRRWKSGVHSDRTIAFRDWKIRRPEKYLKLRAQVEAQIKPDAVEWASCPSKGNHDRAVFEARAGQSN